MFAAADTGPRQKCYVTHGTLPMDLRSKNAPRSKKPFSTILANPWYHTVDLVLPEELMAVVQDSIDRESHFLHYSRVHMKLEELIEGDFFNLYIKTGNIEMLSQGLPTIETQYSLREGTLPQSFCHRSTKLTYHAGILRLDLPKHIYQRLGLDGRPISSGGRKHIVSRMRIEINLRQPSMVTGRKGFERIRWAFKTVLNESVTWLFRDATAHKSTPDDKSQNSSPVDKFHPLARCAHPPSQNTLDNILTPDLAAPPRNPTLSSSHLRSDTCHETLEWLSLVMTHSPRISSIDSIDPYLCRYSLPIPTSTSTTESSPQSSVPIAISLSTLRWHGFLPASWLQRLVAGCVSMLQSRPDAWFAVGANAFRLEMGGNRRDGCCLLMPPAVKWHGADAAAAAADSAADGEDSMSVDATPDSTDRSGHGHGDISKDVESGSPLPHGDQTQNHQRDFLLWDFVDCVSQR